MSTLSFEPTVIPGGNDDAAPDTIAPEYPCEVCGKEAGPYKGRGRKPKRCADHKRNATAGATSGVKTKGSNAALAASAADALCQWNGLVVVGCMVAGFTDTGSAISSRESVFREQAYSALITDPALCRTILRAGATSGKLSLLMAYGMLGISVAPVAMNEYKERQAIKEEAEERKAA